MLQDVIDKRQPKDTHNIAKDIKRCIVLNNAIGPIGIQFRFTQKHFCTAFGVLIVENESYLRNNYNFSVYPLQRNNQCSIDPYQNNNKGKKWSQQQWLINKTHKFKQTDYLKQRTGKSKKLSDFKPKSVQNVQNQQTLIEDENVTQEFSNILFMNCYGYAKNDNNIKDICKEYKIDTILLMETHKTEDINVFDQEINSQAIKDNNAGRAAGGVYIGSNQVLKNCINKQGFVKATINDIIQVLAQFNEKGVRLNHDQFQEQVRENVLKNNKLVICADYNQLKDSNITIMRALGLQRVNNSPSQYRNGIGYCNDQVWTYNVAASMLKQLKAFSLSVQHLSDHDCIIFKVSSQSLSRLRKKLIIPSDEDKLNDFIDTINFKIDNLNSHIDSLDLFYQAVYSAANELNCIQNIRPGKPLKNNMNKFQKETFKKLINHQNLVKHTDPVEYSKRKKVTDTYAKHMKAKNWLKLTNDAVQNNKQFNLFNRLNKAGKVWIDGKNINEHKSKLPLIKESVEKTSEMWQSAFNSKFNPDNQELIESEQMIQNAESIKVTEPMIEVALSKCKMNAAPGKSLISQNLIKKIQLKNKEFIMKLLNDVMNNKVNPSVFTSLTIIPIQKNPKKGLQTEVSSFRPVSLGDTLYKLTESIQISHNIRKIEATMGTNQFAYKRGGGTQKAMMQLNQLMKKHKTGQIISVDLKGAFDSCKHKKAVELLFRKYGNSLFLHMYKDILKELHMEIDLKFTKVKKVKYRIGMPQGLKLSCFGFTTILNEAMTEQRDHALNKNLDIDDVDYSDDLTFVTKFQQIFIILQPKLCNVLANWGLQLEKEKTNFIRFGPDSDKLVDCFKDPEDPQKIIKVSNHLKFLGYFIPDKVGISIEYHLNQRISCSNQFLEGKYLSYVKKSLHFNTTAKRTFFLNRYLSKIFQGLNTLVDLKQDFSTKQQVMKNGIKYLDEKWYEIKIPELNQIYSRQVIDKLKLLVDGMNLPNLIPVVLKIKPPHVLGQRLTDDDQLKYWAGNKGSYPIQFIKENQTVINQLHRRKQQLLSDNRLLNLFMGHYQLWYKQQANKEYCPQCNAKFNHLNLFSTSRCCGLKPEGIIPKKMPTNLSHIKALKYIDKLKHFKMFQIDKQQRWQNKAPNNSYLLNYNIPQKTLELDGFRLAREDFHRSHEAIVVQTDGSAFKDKIAGCGVQFVNGHLYNLENKSMMCPPPFSNQRAELFAILIALQLTNTQELRGKKLYIRTDSMQSLNCITTWFERMNHNNFINKKGILQSHSEIIQGIKLQMKDRLVDICWVKGHGSSVQNNQADELSGRITKEQINNNKVLE